MLLPRAELAEQFDLASSPSLDFSTSPPLLLSLYSLPSRIASGLFDLLRLGFVGARLSGLVPHVRAPAKPSLL